MSIPVTVVGGYLGAGKTTLINRLLRNSEGLRLAVLVNEFGELPIDQDLIVSKDDRLITLSGGCICCTFGSDLAGALSDLADRGIGVDHILIEASGVAIPAAVIGSVSLLKGFSANSTVVLANADQVRENACARYIGDTILRQLANADLVLVTKCDLVEAQDLNEVVQWCGEVSPGAQVIVANSESLRISSLLAPVSADRSNVDTSGHADELFESFILRPGPLQNPESFAMELATGGYGVARAKGYVPDLSGNRFLVQIVGANWKVELADGSKGEGVVVIGLRNELELNGFPF